MKIGENLNEFNQLRRIDRNKWLNGSIVGNCLIYYIRKIYINKYAFIMIVSNNNRFLTNLY